MKTIVTRKGQITLPISLRRKYGIKEGMKVTIEDTIRIILKVVPE
jgi:AbrB family looped-hinge helix DNA binding protein